MPGAMKSDNYFGILLGPGMDVGIPPEKEVLVQIQKASGYLKSATEELIAPNKAALAQAGANFI